MAFADLVARLRLDTAAFTNAMNNVRRQTQRFSTQIAAATANGSADQLIAGYTSLNDRLHTVGLGLRDISRIAAGITISQTFYGITRSIREATSALWEFNESIDYAQVTYGALFGDSTLATDFIDVLKDFSVDTIFEYSDIEGMARKLSAYGIEYKNLMYIIEGLTNIGTISGDTAALERLAVAIGQINAKGTLKAEEMRQLANAYTPIYDILRDKLGLTEDELGRVGDLGIKSADAINAIIEYANETFGATADAAVMTITGLNNKVVDSLKVLGSAAIAPMTTFYKSVVKYLADGLGELQNAFDSGGMGAVFEKLIPSEVWQHRIRSLIASIKNALSTMVAHFMTMWPYIKQFLGGVIEVFTLFLSIINVVSTAIVGLLQNISNNTPILHTLTTALVAAAGGWLLFKIHAMGAMVISVLKVIIVDVAKAVVFLTTVLTRHPLIAGLTILGAVLLGVASNAKNTNSAISNLINSFNSFSIGGDTADDILQVEDAMNSGADAGDKFWEEMEGGAEDTEEAIKGAGDAAKKAGKNLLSFDEVFRLNDDKDTGIGDGALGGIGDLAESLSGLGSALIPEIPDLSSFANDFVSTLYNDLYESIKTIASGGAVGAVIGGLVGFTIGGFVTKSMKGALTGAKWGARIGTVAGAAFAGFWTDTYKEMEESLKKIAVGSATGLLAGGLLGMVVGAFATKTVDGALTGAKYGAAIGSVLGGGIGAFWAGATEEMSNAIEGIVVGTGIGALVGGLTGLLIGAYSTKTLDGALTAAKLGAGVGSLVGGAFGGIFTTASDELKKQIADITYKTVDGAFFGGLAGMLLGAFVTKTINGALTGAKLGATTGALLGGTSGAISTIFDGLEGEVKTKIGGLFSDISAASYGSVIGGAVGAILGAIIGALAGGVGALPGAKLGATLGAAIGSIGGIVYNKLKDGKVIENIGKWLGELSDTVVEWLTTDVPKWLSDTKTKVTTWFDDLKTDISNWFTERKTDIKDWWSDLWTGWNTGWSMVVAWFDDLKTDISNWFTERKTDVKNWWSNMWTGWNTGWSMVVAWFTQLKTDISNWFVERKTDVKNWWSAMWTGWATAWSMVVAWFSQLKTDIANWFVAQKTNVATLWSNMWTGWKSGWSHVSNWFLGLKQDTTAWFQGTKESVKTWWGNLWTGWKSGWSMVKEWFSTFLTDIKTWFTNLGTNIGTWWSNAWDNAKDTGAGIIGGVKTTVGNLLGHAEGGIYNREHIARFAEGNKAEAIIPLENNSAMQPFVDAVSNGLLQNLMPAMATAGGGANLPPMYVGTLIADERGLQQLYKKFELYEAEELARKGLL